MDFHERPDPYAVYLAGQIAGMLRRFTEQFIRDQLESLASHRDQLGS
jgi:hypothetical protein